MSELGVIEDFGKGHIATRIENGRKITYWVSEEKSQTNNQNKQTKQNQQSTNK